MKYSEEHKKDLLSILIWMVVIFGLVAFIVYGTSDKVWNAGEVQGDEVEQYWDNYEE